LRLVVHIHALRKNIFEGSKVMDQRLLAIFIFFPRERYTFFSQRVFIAVHQIFIFSENSNKARIKLYEHKGAF